MAEANRSLILRVSIFCLVSLLNTGCSAGNLECTPNTEICDGKDNNCDGKIDEAFPEINTSCVVNSKNGCLNRGTYECFNGELGCDFQDYWSKVYLTALPISCNEIRLNWSYHQYEDFNSNSNGYVIQRKVENGEYQDIATINDGGILEYIDIDVSPWTVYYYMVRGRGEKEDSGCSNEVFTTTADINLEIITTLGSDLYGIEVTATVDNQSHIHVAFCKNWELFYANNIEGNWSLPEKLEGGNGCDRISIASDSNNTIHLLNFRSTSDPDLSYYTNKSGQWEAILITWFVWSGSEIKIDNNDNIQFVYEKDEHGEKDYGEASIIYVLITQDEKQETVITENGGYPSMIMDNNFTPYVTFYVWDDNEDQLIEKLAKKTGDQWDIQTAGEHSFRAFDGSNIPHTLEGSSDNIDGIIVTTLYHLWFENNIWQSEIVWTGSSVSGICGSIKIDKNTNAIHTLCGYNTYFYKKNAKWIPVMIGDCDFMNSGNLVLNPNGQAHIIIRNDETLNLEHLTIQECQ